MDINKSAINLCLITKWLPGKSFWKQLLSVLSRDVFILQCNIIYQKSKNWVIFWEHFIISMNTHSLFKKDDFHKQQVKYLWVRFNCIVWRLILFPIFCFNYFVLSYIKTKNAPRGIYKNIFWTEQVNQPVCRFWFKKQNWWQFLLYHFTASQTEFHYLLL